MLSLLSTLLPRPLGLLALLLVLVAPVQVQQPSSTSDDNQSDTVAPQDQAAQDEQIEPDAALSPVFRSGINFIRVDAVVTDNDGNHVTDLDVSDFEVYEDGELQTIETFERVAIGAVPEPDARPATSISNRNDEEREADRRDVRVFVIFFDDYHVRFENGQRASLQLTEFLRNNLLPTDLVAVMYPLTPVSDVRFSRNHDAVIAQVEEFYVLKYRY